MIVKVKTITCNPYRSLLPANAFPNGEPTDGGDVEKMGKTQVSSGAGPTQPLSENDTAPAQPMSASSHRCRGRDGREVGVDFDVRELSLEIEGKGGIIFTHILWGL